MKTRRQEDKKTRRLDDSQLTDTHIVSPYNQLEGEASYFFNITILK